MANRRVVVVTSCTSRKRTLRPGEDVAAEDLYTGEQHRRLMEGVRAARVGGVTVDLRIVSAGYGLVRSDERLVEYDRSFARMRSAEIDQASEDLAVSRDVTDLLGKPYDLALVLLGSDYLRATRFFEVESLGGATLVLCGHAEAVRLGATPQVHAIVAGKSEARSYSCGLVGLKGEMARRILLGIAQHPELLAAIAAGERKPIDDFLEKSGPDQLEIAA